MGDVLTPAQRRHNMSRIRAKDTAPELQLRRLLHARGFRYRIHVVDLPGRPDLVFPGLKKVIFVNGCFWHLHACRFGQVSPATNAAFWEDKRTATVKRDTRNRAQLDALGWSTLTVWECELRAPEAATKVAVEFLTR